MAERFRLLREIGRDLRRKAEWCYDDGSWKSVVKAAMTDGSASMVIYRLMQEAHRRELGAAEMVLNKLNGVVSSCVIGRGAELGPGLVMVHSHGIVINGAVKAGANLTLEHQVTIGAEKRQSPTIGNDVFIGAGAKIIGPVTIGDGARIGANAVVIHDVPAHTTVVGNPARPVQRRAGREREAREREAAEIEAAREAAADESESA